MALDGVTLRFITDEINRELAGARVDKVLQPEKDEIDLVFRRRGPGIRLLLSASSSNPRVHFTARSKENPMTPPMLCMLLRKHLQGAKFAAARQAGFERIVFLDFDGRNELGDEVRRTIAVEIMGRHSNIILIDENGRIMDAVKHIDASLSRIRQVLPGLRYELPPQQDKLDLAESGAEPVLARVKAHRPAELAKALLDTVQGFSPVVCRELAQLACRDSGARTDALDAHAEERLRFFLERTAELIRTRAGTPVMAVDAKSGRPLDFSFMELTQYGRLAATRSYPGFSQLLDAFYFERDRVERINQRAHDILHLLTNTVERVGNKLGRQRQELEECAGRESLKVAGDLISTNLYRLGKGQTACELENYYLPDSPKQIIELDPALTPAQNAQKYYREYRKAAVAEKVLREQIEAGEAELAYLDTVFDELSRAQGETDLLEIRRELEGEGYLRSRGRGKDRRAAQGAGAPERYLTAAGSEIRIGRNNRQNDQLTLKTARKDDVWLHTKNIPGAHVIVTAKGGAVDEETLLAAAKLAAAHSKAKDSSKVPVDYTQVRNVHKPAGAKPGMVIYEHYRTLYVAPDPAAAQKA